MTTTTRIMAPGDYTDADLVSRSLSGDRDAFGYIVARYQSLICSLTYGAMGNLGQSEDVAQETFITAWKRLGHLREPAKLRAWLCGIARNRANKSLDREGREPAHRAEVLETDEQAPAREPLPSDQAITREEADLLWRSLEKIPEIYREPIILFYREQQSIERVASALELSEDVVKQRLSRGRKLLQDEVMAFVEGALVRTSPGKTFTLAVVAALPLMAASAQAGAIGAAVVKGTAVTKPAAVSGAAGGVLGMLAGGYISTKAGIENTKSPRERSFRVRMAWIGVTCGVPMVAMFCAALAFNAANHTVGLEVVIASTLFGMAVFSAAAFSYMHRRQRQIQVEEGTFLESEWAEGKARPGQSNDPRRETSTSNAYVTAAKYMAAPLAWMMVLTAQAFRAGRSMNGLLILAASGLIYFLAVRAMQRWPRFSTPTTFRIFAPPFATLATIAVAFGLFTLMQFNLRRTLGEAAMGVSNEITRHWTISFNAGVALVYVVFIAFFAWKCMRRPGPQNSLVA